MDEATFAPFIDERLHRAVRDRNSVYCHPNDFPDEKIWIDLTFAVTPFLLLCGLRLNRTGCLDEVWAQTRKLVQALRDPANGDWGDFAVK